jgi:transposase
MAMNVERVILGADVSKDWLDLNREGEERVERIDNERAAIDAWLQRYRGASLAVEATNTYHELIVERARRLGLVVYLVSGYQLKHYGAAVGQRMRTDAIDARLIARFLAREIDRLKPYEPKSAQHAELWQLLKRRAALVQARQQIRQSLSGIKTLQRSQQQLSRSFERILDDLDAKLECLIDALGWRADVQRLCRLPGVGRLTAVALVAAYRSGTFSHHDPFIAYLGLDVRAKDSGYFKGQRKLSKHGDGEYRRLLFCSAMAACRSDEQFKARYQELLSRGRASTAAFIIVARKLATVAFALLQKQVDFDASRLLTRSRHLTAAGQALS